MTHTEHVEAARAWAKVLAFRKCGNEVEAARWWAKLASMLGYTPEGRQRLPAVGYPYGPGVPCVGNARMDAPISAGD